MHVIWLLYGGRSWDVGGICFFRHGCDERSSLSRKCRQDGGIVEDDGVDTDDSVTLTAETREAVAAVKFIAGHLKEEDDFDEV